MGDATGKVTVNTRKTGIWQRWLMPVVIGLIWIGVITGFGFDRFSGAEPEPLDLMSATLLAATLFLPLILIWATTTLLGAISAQRAELTALKDGLEILYAEIVALRKALDKSARPDTAPAERVLKPAPAPAPGIVAPKPLAAKVNPPQPKHPGAPPSQPQLPMETPAPDPALTSTELIAALDFPKDASDGAGFASLRKAAKARDIGQLLQSAEDMLNLLARLGIFMDDLSNVASSASAWRSFASGTRGMTVASLGRVGGDDVAKKIRAQLRIDPIFRDTSLHFQRRFDTALERFAATASDNELAELANTRTARAFTLLAQANVPPSMLKAEETPDDGE